MQHVDHAYSDRAGDERQRRRYRTRLLFAALTAVGVLLVVGFFMTQRPSAPTPEAADGLQVADQQDVAAAAEAARSAFEESAEESTANEPLPAAAPVRMAIGSVDIASDLHVVGLNDDKTLEVPSGAKYDEAAWYDGSPTPGELGPSVLLGHVTNTGPVPSVFFDLGEVSVGEEIEVERDDGTTAIFTVYAVDSFPKDDFPTEAVYGDTDVPELRVITCGGEYVADARSHEDNVVVFAQLSQTKA